MTHVDYSARIQTVVRETNPVLPHHSSAFEDLTGCPVIVNTSFNIRGEPIVCTPEDAYSCFMKTEMDYLILEDHVLDKRQQPGRENSRVVRDFDGARLMRRAVYAWRLLREFGSYAVVNRAYWVIPLIVLFLGVAGFIGVVQITVPFTLYALF